MSDLYTIDYAKAKKLGFLSELVVLKTFGALEKVEKIQCDDCGYASPVPPGPESEFIVIGKKVAGKVLHL